MGDWRRIGSRERRPYKYVVIALFLILGSQAWSLSYRLTYLRVAGDHLLLHAHHALVLAVMP